MLFCAKCRIHQLFNAIFLSGLDSDLSSVVLFGSCIDGVVLRDKSVSECLAMCVLSANGRGEVERTEEERMGEEERREDEIVLIRK